jgi:hypothetical protein
LKRLCNVFSGKLRVGFGKLRVGKRCNTHVRRTGTFDAAPGYSKERREASSCTIDKLASPLAAVGPACEIELEYLLYLLTEAVERLQI